MFSLPIIESCEGCGACCRQTPVPPFEDAEEIQREVPEEYLIPVQERIQSGEHMEVAACVWFDAERGLCRHYEFRPEACRRFEVSSFECHAARNAELYP